ncbi:MAG TPA: hypothetical protein VKK81_22710, partial [Candidatus Binatia bacterium]|nr:hypothetical protein [Candidatus Binatia bacterium]
TRVMSEDAVRRGLKAIPEAEGIPWLSGHLDYCTAPLLGEDWVLDADTAADATELPFLGSNVRRLGCTSCVHDSKEIRLAPRTTAAALKLGSLLDCKRHMVDITLDLRRGLECDCLPTDDARHRTADDHLLTCDHSRYFALLTDYNFSSHHVALDLAIYLKDATADDLQPLADDLEVVPDDGFFTR